LKNIGIHELELFIFKALILQFVAVLFPETETSLWFSLFV